MPTRIEIKSGQLDPNQASVTLKHANNDTALWFTKDPGSGSNKYAQYWIAFDNDPFDEHVITTDPQTGETPTFKTRGHDSNKPVSGQYTIYTADPSKRTNGKHKVLAVGGGGIIIDN